MRARLGKGLVALAIAGTSLFGTATAAHADTHPTPGIYVVGCANGWCYQMYSGDGGATWTILSQWRQPEAQATQ